MPLRPLRPFMMFLAFGLAACTSPDEKAARAAADAQTAFQQGRNAAALRSIREALAARDDVSDYWLLLGRINATTNNLPGAFTAYENVIQLDHGNIEALRILCQLGLSVGSPDKVDTYADQLLLLTPGDPLPIIMKGGAALARGDGTTALTLAEQVLAKQPQDSSALILKGRVLASQGDYVGAAKFISGTMSGGDDSPRLVFLKDLYTQAGDRARYQQTVKQLSAAKPDDADQQLDYADMLYQTGQTAAASALIVQQMVRHPHDISLAAKIFDVWLEQGPTALSPQQMKTQAAGVSIEMKSAYARFANEIGQPELALALSGGSLDRQEVSVSNADAKAAAAYATGLLGHRADALRRLDAILAFDDTHPGALLARARIKALGKDINGAIADARQVVADDPRNVTARLVLEEFFIATGDRDLARATLREGVRTMPDEPRLAARLVADLSSTGERAAAIEVLRHLVRAAPVSLRALRLRAALDPSAPKEPDILHLAGAQAAK